MALTQISTNGIKDANVNTADIADDAVTSAKLAANAVDSNALGTNVVTTSKIAADNIVNSLIADNAVESANIADQAVTLAKLPHGTSSNNGKFLRANNGADPTFETVTGTTINNNADNRIITGSGTANTLEGEAGLTYNGQKLVINTVTAEGSAIKLYDTTASSQVWYVNGEGNSFQGHIYPRTDSNLDLGYHATNKWRDVVLSGGIRYGNATDANYLDDYEEGNWTPAVSGGSGTSHGEQYGRYTKVGRLVVVSARIKFSCNGTSGNQLSVGGLPFQSASGTGENYTSGGISYCNLTLDANRFHPYVGDTSNTVFFYEMNSGAGVNIGGSFSNKYLGFSAHYFT